MRVSMKMSFRVHPSRVVETSWDAVLRRRLRSHQQIFFKHLLFTQHSVIIRILHKGVHWSTNTCCFGQGQCAVHIHHPWPQSFQGWPELLLGLFQSVIAETYLYRLRNPSLASPTPALSVLPIHSTESINPLFTTLDLPLTVRACSVQDTEGQKCQRIHSPRSWW